MSPLTATTADVPRVAAMTTTMRTRLTEAPKAVASSSPTRMMSSSRRCINSTAELTTTYGSTRRTSPQVAELKRPRIQEYT